MCCNITTIKIGLMSSIVMPEYLASIYITLKFYVLYILVVIVLEIF